MVMIRSAREWFSFYKLRHYRFTRIHKAGEEMIREPVLMSRTSVALKMATPISSSIYGYESRSTDINSNGCENESQGNPVPV